MSWKHPTADDFDHAHDLRKHEQPPHRLDASIPTAVEVALIVRGLANVNDGAALIEQYARAVAAGEALEATRAVSRAVDKVLSGGLA